MLAFAGLWDRWIDPDSDEVISATMIVSGASAWMAPYHDRMPVLLDPQNFDAWLDGSPVRMRSTRRPRDCANAASQRLNRPGWR